MTTQMESGARPLIVSDDSIEDLTGTVQCEACDGSYLGCDECYDGRISGYREHEGHDGAPRFDVVPCTPEQRAAVDAYYASDRPCPTCGRPVPTTASLPICAACTATARVTGAQGAEATRQDQERAA